MTKNKIEETELPDFRDWMCPTGTEVTTHFRVASSVRHNQDVIMKTH